jgi:hypothetical protein
VHDAFAKFYDWVLQNPAAQIYLGKTGTFDMYVSATKALLDLQNVTYNIADTGGGLTGDSTFVQYDSSATFPQFATSTLNPGVWFSYAGNQGNGDIGLNYTILHEIGHSLLAFEFGMSAQADEMAANTAGRSIETALGMTLLTVTPGGFYTP